LKQVPSDRRFDFESEYNRPVHESQSYKPVYIDRPFESVNKNLYYEEIPYESGYNQPDYYESSENEIKNESSYESRSLQIEAKMPSLEFGSQYRNQLNSDYESKMAQYNRDYLGNSNTIGSFNPNNEKEETRPIYENKPAKSGQQESLESSSSTFPRTFIINSNSINGYSQTPFEAVPRIRGEYESEARKPIYERKSQESEFTKPTFEGKSKESEFTKPTYERKSQESEFRRPIYERKLQQSEFTKPVYERTFQKSEFTRPIYERKFQESELRRPIYERKFQESEFTRPIYENDNSPSLLAELFETAPTYIISLPEYFEGVPSFSDYPQILTPTNEITRNNYETNYKKSLFEGSPHKRDILAAYLAESLLTETTPPSFYQSVSPFSGYQDFYFPSRLFLNSFL
jgi:hypothetical protein